MASSSALTTPEFMWCQRSDRLYVTIKVADCAKPSVHIADDVLKFRGVGHGMCGTREYGFELALAGGVDVTRCRWFVCGPSVRVLLEGGARPVLGRAAAREARSARSTGRAGSTRTRRRR